MSKRSTDSHDIALLSLHTGARAGEIFSLTWGNIAPFSGTILLKDTKSNKNRHLFMTDAVKKMFLHRRNTDSKKTDLIFPDKKGNKRDQISKTFYRVVDEMGLNIDVTDRPRQSNLPYPTAYLRQFVGSKRGGYIHRQGTPWTLQHNPYRTIFPPIRKRP